MDLGCRIHGECHCLGGFLGRTLCHFAWLFGFLPVVARAQLLLDTPYFFSNRLCADGSAAAESVHWDLSQTRITFGSDGKLRLSNMSVSPVDLVEPYQIINGAIVSRNWETGRTEAIEIQVGKSSFSMIYHLPRQAKKICPHSDSIVTVYRAEPSKAP